MPEEVHDAGPRRYFRAPRLPLAVYAAYLAMLFSLGQYYSPGTRTPADRRADRSCPVPAFRRRAAVVVGRRRRDDGVAGGQRSRRVRPDLWRLLPDRSGAEQQGRSCRGTAFIRSVATLPDWTRPHAQAGVAVVSIRSTGVPAASSRLSATFTDESSLRLRR